MSGSQISKYVGRMKRNFCVFNKLVCECSLDKEQDDVIRSQKRKPVDWKRTIEMCYYPKTISAFLVLLHPGLLLKPEIQDVLLFGTLPRWVGECDGVQQRADRPAHARRPHARRGPQGAAQPHQRATIFPLPLLCQQRSPERHLSSCCLQLRSCNDCGSECTRWLEGDALFKTLLPQPQNLRAVCLLGFLFMFSFAI